MKLYEYEGCNVRLITTIGNIFEGYVLDFIEAEDNEPERESLIIGDNEIFEDEIESIEILKEQAIENNSMIFCPLVDRLIDVVDCMENRDTKEEVIPIEYKLKKNWKEICRNCLYYEY